MRHKRRVCKNVRQASALAFHRVSVDLHEQQLEDGTTMYETRCDATAFGRRQRFEFMSDMHDMILSREGVRL